jgi:hypothetical protein
VVLLVLLSACSVRTTSKQGLRSSSVSDAEASAGLGGAPVGYVRDCGTDVYGDLGPARRWQRRSILVGPFAFVWIRDAARVSNRTIMRAYRAGQGAFKILALVKPGREVTVAVPLAERRHVALLYDPSRFNQAQTVANGERAVIFRACKRAGTGRSSWRQATQFNGGIVVDRARCVVLDLRISTRGPSRRIRAAFGKQACKRRA